MKRNYFYLIFLNFLITNAQTNSDVNWINSNAIVIEDANPNNKLIAFQKNTPQNFKKARIFGFGEASHHGKEFFDLKIKFFKYLVENQNVKTFLMEESYQAEEGINEWISGGKGDETTILKNFGQGIWHCNEVVELLKWMREYNIGKPYEKQLRFYGIDNQFGNGINLKLRDYVKKHKIIIDEELLVVADSCSEKKLTVGGIKNWADIQLPKLKQIEQILISHNDKHSNKNIFEYQDLIRALNYLQKYTSFLQFPSSKTRDKDMSDNVIWIMEHEGQNSKAFIWAHNEHINKKDLYTYNMKSLGRNLKDKYNDEYYCVGFDFGKGSLRGYIFENNKVLAATIRTLDKPYKNTFAETLFLADSEIYYIDLQQTSDNEPAHFLNKKNRQLFLGGPGFDPKNNTFLKRKYTESYDGLIFVKTISPATY